MNDNKHKNQRMHLQSTIGHWDAYWQKNNLEYSRKTVEELHRIIGTKDKEVIEIGAGSGATSIYLAQGGARVTCLDYSEKALAVVTAKAFKAGIELMRIRADAISIPIADNTFDICFHQGVIEHLRNPEAALREQYRILKKEGILLVDVPQKYNFYTTRKWFKMHFGKWFAGWETEFSLGQLRKLLQNSGFTFIRGYGRYHFRNLDRVQMRLFKRRFIPDILERWFYRIVSRIENSFIGPYTAFSLGVIAIKKA